MVVVNRCSGVHTASLLLLLVLLLHRLILPLLSLLVHSIVVPRAPPRVHLQVAGALLSCHLIVLCLLATIQCMPL